MLVMVATGDLIVNVKGTWVRREPSDLDDGAALARINQKAYATGKELQNVTLGTPSTVPYQPPAPPVMGQLPFNPGPGGPTAPRGGSGAGASPGGGGATPYVVGGTVNGGRALSENEKAVPLKPYLKTYRSTGPRTKANLQGELFQWQIDNKQIQAVRLSIPSLSPAELKELISKLPANIKLEMEVDVADTPA
jgi:hypothetical protein